MKKQIIIWAIVTTIVMLLFPWIAKVAFPGDEFMAIVLLLFFAVDPLCSVLSGVIAARRTEKLWWMPIASAILCVAGMWISLDMGNTAFLFYALIYLALGMSAMLLLSLIKKLRRQRRNKHNTTV